MGSERGGGEKHLGESELILKDPNVSQSYTGALPDKTH